MEEQIKTAPQTDVEVVDIQFRSGQKIYFFDPDGQHFADGDHIIIDTARGEEFGICVGGNHKIPPKNVVAPLRKVLRRATSQDEKTIQENRAKEKRAFEVCQQKIAEHGLDMQLVNAEVAFDGSKILFYFTADERVDFRELVKNLASVFRTRIELRQIGVRDKARMVGGLGICGRPFCCASSRKNTARRKRSELKSRGGSAPALLWFMACPTCRLAPLAAWLARLTALPVPTLPPVSCYGIRSLSPNRSGFG